MGEAYWGPQRTPVVPAPADPWAGMTSEVPIVQRMPKRRIHGRIYETIESGQRDGEHRYVGMTEQTLHQRVHASPSAHTSRASVAKDLWKARILPGAAGYRLLENVYDTGDPAENDRALRRAEAFWIDRLRPTRNTVRPVRPPGDRPAPRAKGPTRQEIAEQRRRRRATRRLLAILAIGAFFTYLAARVVIAMQLPWPAAPWVVAPVVGVAAGWLVFWHLHRAVRKLVR